MTSAKPKQRKLALSVGCWSSEEATFTWKFIRNHLAQPRDSLMWDDQLYILHAAKAPERERWDQGGPVISDVATATDGYNVIVAELEGDPAPVIIEYVNKEGFDMLVLASRARGAMTKAMLGSATDTIMQRVGCACMIVKPQVGAGDTYRLRTAKATPTTAAQLLHATTMPAMPTGSGGSLRSPSGSPMFARYGSIGGVATPFNRRVCIAYDTTANGRFLLKWAADTLLEKGDNVFVVRALPRVRNPSTSFNDKTNAHRLSLEMLGHMPHVTPYNLTVGNARRAVLSFVEQESVDILVLGMFKERTKRKGLAVKGNAAALYNRCACTALVVPMTEAALQRSVKPHDLELAVREEEELATGSESESDEDGDNAPATGGLPSPQAAGSAAPAGERSRKGGALDALFWWRGTPAGRTAGGSDAADGGAVAATAAGEEPQPQRQPQTAAKLAAALASAGVVAGSVYTMELDAAGGLKNLALVGEGAEPSTSAPQAAAAGDEAAALRQRLADREREVAALRQQLATLQAAAQDGGGGSGSSPGMRSD